MPELSIVITTWNSLSHIRKCLESIISLDIPNVETIVVDSNSTDGTKEYLNELSHSLDASKLGLKVLPSNRRIKWSEANQIGLDQSKGEWVCLSNPDIVFNTGFLGMLESCSRSNALVVAPQLTSQDGTPQGPMRLVTPSVFFLSTTGTGSLIRRIIGRHLPSYWVKYQWNGEDMVQVDNPVGSFFMVRRQVLNMLNGRLWNKGYLNGVSDLDAFLNFKRRGIPVNLYPSCRMIHYGSHITRSNRSWVEYDQSYGIVLYFRYWKMFPRLSTVLLGIEGIVAVPVEIMLKMVKPHQSFFNPGVRAWKAGQRLMGLLDGWRFPVVENDRSLAS